MPRIWVGPLQTRTFAWDFIPPQRGEYSADRIALRSGFPFGLWHPSRPVLGGASLLVWPAAVDVSALAESMMPSREGGNRSRQLRGDDTEWFGIRAYRRGDSVRLVHRAQSARHARLVVREVATAAQPAVRIVLDSAAQSYSTSACRETAIRKAAALFDAMLARGVRVELVLEGRLLPWSIKPRKPGLDAFARISAVGGPPLADLLCSPLCRHRQATLVMITSAAAENQIKLSASNDEAVRVATFLVAEQNEEPASGAPAVCTGTAKAGLVA